MPGVWELEPGSPPPKKGFCFGFYGLGVLYYSLAEGRLYLHPWQAVPSAVEDIEVSDMKVRAALYMWQGSVNGCSNRLAGGSYDDGSVTEICLDFLLADRHCSAKNTHLLGASCDSVSFVSVEIRGYCGMTFRPGGPVPV